MMAVEYGNDESKETMRMW